MSSIEGKQSNLSTYIKNTYLKYSKNLNVKRNVYCNVENEYSNRDVENEYSNRDVDKVTKLYNRILKRTPDSDGLKLYENMNSEKIEFHLWNSKEAFELYGIYDNYTKINTYPEIINYAYNTILKRDCDPSGMSVYSKFLNSNKDLKKLFDILLESDEYKRTNNARQLDV
tara:strand:+ start:157 stop:666 length:510 start_codon:yes stop_codon:yes gene_type:complete